MPTPKDKEPQLMTLADLAPGQRGTIKRIEADSSLKRRLAAMGVVNGIKVSLDHTAPMGDPRAYTVMDYSLSMRNAEASRVVLHLDD